MTTPFSAAISAEDRQALQNALADAIGVVTQQGRQELAGYVAEYTPALALYGPLAAAGDAVAAKNLDHLRAQMLTDAAIYGIKVLETEQKAFLTAVDVFSRVVVRLIIPA